MGILISGLAIAAIVAMACSDGSKTSTKVVTETPQAPPPGSKTLVLGGGCFWCTEAVYEELKGVVSVESGYAGGTVVNPTYDQVCTGTTGHAEVIKITYDPKEISAKDILRIFFTVHDPTTLNRQGPDSGTQYRSVIFYTNDKEKTLAEEVIKEVTDEKIWPNPIVTTLEPLKNYAKAEDYHQDYFDKFENGGAVERASMNSGYCSLIIEPKVQKFRQKYADKLKKK
jgi:peptide-methionine (S)-S-oxide reductase